MIDPKPLRKTAIRLAACAPATGTPVRRTRTTWWPSDRPLAGRYSRGRPAIP